jgi:hypothetical protein
MKTFLFVLSFILFINASLASDGPYNLMGTWKSADNSIGITYDGISLLTIKSSNENVVLDCSDFVLSASNEEVIVRADQLLVCRPIDSTTEIYQFYIRLIAENPSAIIKVMTNLSVERVGTLDSYTFRRL